MITVAGLTSSYKVPGSVREVNYGRGRRNPGSGIVKLVCTGTKTSSGSATADLDIVQVFSDEDADSYLGAGSEAAIQCYAALKVPGAKVFAAPVAENGSAVAGSLTITIGGSWPSVGSVGVWLDGKLFSVTVTAAMTTTNVATALASRINSDSRLFCTAGSAAAVVTLTTRSKGIRMNQWICRKDLSLAPTGLTAVLAGGTALNAYMTPFSAGAGADDIAAVLALLATDRWHYLAIAQNDATNAGLVRTHLTSEAGGLIMHTEHAVMALTRGTSTSTSFASATLNHARMSLVHFTNSENHPSAIAAHLAAIRSATVGNNPNTRYNNAPCVALAPQSQKADVASNSVNDTLLNSGVTPLTTTADGRVLIVRAIQSHCLNGSSPDDRTLDWGEADTPDRASDEVGADWEVHSENNQYVSAEPAAGAETPPSGVTFPSLWNATVTARLKTMERANWLQDVDANPPITEFQTDRLMTAMTLKVRLQNHILGLQSNQTSARG